MVPLPTVIVGELRRMPVSVRPAGKGFSIVEALPPHERRQHTRLSRNKPTRKMIMRRRGECHRIVKSEVDHILNARLSECTENYRNCFIVPSADKAERRAANQTFMLFPVSSLSEISNCDAPT